MEGMATSVIFGTEILTEAMMTDFAPATLVRIRGSILWAHNGAVTEGTGNTAAAFWWAVRKVRLSKTTAVYAAPTSTNLKDGAYLSGEDILAFGCVSIDGLDFAAAAGTPKTYRRGTGIVDVDIKAKRKFTSAEERLVLETQLAAGALVPSVDCFLGLRLLFLAG